MARNKKTKTELTSKNSKKPLCNHPEDALDQYQNGIALLRFCQQTLSNAEARIETLHPAPHPDDAPERLGEDV